MKLELLDSFGDLKSPIYALSRGTHADSFFTASANGVVSEWNTEYGVASEIQVKAQGAVFSLLYDEQTQFLWIGCQPSTLSIVNLQDKKEIKNYNVHPGGVFDIQIVQDRILSVGGDGNVIEWNRSDGSYLRTLPLGTSKIRRFAVSPHESVLAFPLSTGDLEVIEPAYFNTKAKKKVNVVGVASCCYHPKKNVLVTGGRDGELKMLNGKNEYQEILSFPAHTGNIYAVVFHPKEFFLVTASRDKNIKVWDSETLDFLCGASHGRSVNDLLFLENGLLLSASDDGSVRLWKIHRQV